MILYRFGTFAGVGVVVPLAVEYLVVGGDGSGASSAGNLRSAGGGGGGGQVSAGTETNVSLGTPYTVTVGAGGSDVGGFGTCADLPTSGSASVFFVTSAGGSQGRKPDCSDNPQNVVIGGGGSASGNTVKAGSVGSLYSGGDAFANNGPYNASGGGGGAGGNGGNASLGTSGLGGVGVASSITGSSVTYGTGGNGGVTQSAGSAGGLNTGKGGGGSGVDSFADGGSGGSGIVIIRIPNAYTATFSAGTNTLSTAVSGFNIYSCTSTGTRTVTFTAA